MPRIVRRAQPLLGTFVEIAVPSGHALAIDNGFAAIRGVHALMSFHEDGSDVGRINRALPGKTVLCDPRTLEVLARAKQLYRDSGGLFDISVAPQLVRFGFLPANSRKWRAKAACGSPDDIEIAQSAVRLHAPIEIDLGGIAKGYAVDRAIAALAAAGVPSAMVNAGGDLRYFGSEPWPVRLRNADGTPGRDLCLPPCAIASSANLLTRKRRLTRLVTPHVGPGGKPVRIDRTVTVASRRCMVADAMTKVAMLDAQLANRLLARDGGCLLAPSGPNGEPD